MPRFLNGIFTRSTEQQGNKLEGFTGAGAVVLRDRRGSRKGEIPNISEKSETLGSDPLAIYKPTGAKHVDAAKAMANFTGWTYAAVNAIASEVANIQLRLYRISGKDHTELDDHELLDLLEGVNPTMTGTELKYVLMAHLELTGNFYGYLEGVTDENGKPRAIHPLNPGGVKVKLDKSHFPYTISHYEYTFDGKVYSFQPGQILHIRYPDPNDPFVGIGVPQTIPVWIDSDNYAMEYNRKFFLNGAAIGLYIATQTNIEGQIDRIRQGFKDAYSGVENAHKVPAMPKGVELKNAGVSNKDMDMAKLTETTRDRILAGFRVSKTILGTAESDTNRATAETADYVFSKRTIKPKMLLVVAFLNEFLVSRYGDDLYLTFIDPVPEDKEFRTEEMQAAVANQPLMTANEARKTYLGLGPIDGGDKLMAPSAMVEAGVTATPEGENVAPQLAKSRTAEGWLANSFRIRAGGKTAHSAAQRMRKELVKSFAKTIDQSPSFKVKSFKDLSHTEYMEHWKRFADRSEQTEEELRKIFIGINEAQERDVMAAIEELPGLKKIAARKALGDLFDLKEWIGVTVDLATPVLRRLTKDEAAAALAMIGAANQDILADDGVVRALDRGIAKMAKSYNETTLAQLKKVIGEKLGQQGGTNLTELKEAVDGVYSYADERRAGLIAKTESFRAANQANREAWVQSGVVATLKWYTAEDDRVCPECLGLDGKEVGIDQKFFDDHYGDGTTPPAHPDCRCYIRPELIN